MGNPFARFFRSRDKPRDSVSAALAFYFGSSAAGKAVNPRTAVQMTAVYACVRVIAETVASLPLHVYRHTGEGSEKALKHPLYRILHDEPNGEMTSFILRETMLAHLLLWGNAFCQILRNGRGQILGLYPLLPEKMAVDRDNHGTLLYDYTAQSGSIVRLCPEDVLHIPGLGFDGIMGYSPIAIERNAIGAVKSINAARLARLGNGTNRVTLDEVVATMAETGRDMMTKYKETSTGGLAVNLGLPVNITEC